MQTKVFGKIREFWAPYTLSSLLSKKMREKGGREGRKGRNERERV